VSECVSERKREKENVPKQLKDSLPSSGGLITLIWCVCATRGREKESERERVIGSR